MTAPLREARGRMRVSAPTLSMAAGIVCAGATAYGFLVVAGRALGPERYGALSALWALTFLIGLGCFAPLEQEVARSLAERRVLEIGGGPVIARASQVACVLTVGLLVLITASWPLFLGRLLDHQILLLIGLAGGLVGTAVMHLVRGVLAGQGRFVAYGSVLALEGSARLVGAIAVSVAGVESAGAYGIALGVAPLIASVAVLPALRSAIVAGPAAPARQTSVAVGKLLVASVLLQVLLNGPVVAAQWLVPMAERGRAGQFLAAFVVARVPVFLFAAVQAVLLPLLAGTLARDDRSGFWRAVSTTTVIILGLGLVAVAAAGSIGPAVVRFLFGGAFALGRPDLAVLTGGGVAVVVALVLVQALLAAHQQGRVAFGWAFGVVAFVACGLIPGDAVRRVEVAYLVGSVAAAASMGLLLVAGRSDLEPERGDESRLPPPLVP